MVAGGTPPEVVRVESREQAHAAADAIARSFLDNEIWAWLIPNQRARARVERRTYRTMIKRVFVPRRAAWMTEPCTGAALWFPPGTKELTPGEKFAEFLSFLPEGLTSLGRVARLEELIKGNWPEEDHWYLSELAVEPESQGLGHGSALIAPGLELADRYGDGVWLETQSERNLPFYGRFGFDLVKRVEVDAGVPIWMMRRPPGGPTG